MVKGPTRFIERFTEVTVKPDTIQVIHYSEVPATVAFIGAVIDKNRVTIEYLNGDSLWSTVLLIERQPYGKTEIEVTQDTIIQASYPAIGFAPIITAGVNLSGGQLELETFYWNNPPLFDALHFPTIGGFMDYDGEDWGFLAGISGDINSQHTPFRLEGDVQYGIISRKFSVSGSLTFPVWTF
jgi:hypothetical protein